MVALRLGMGVLGRSLLALLFALPSAWGAADCMRDPALEDRIDAMLSAASRFDYRGTLLVEYGKDREFIAVNSRQSEGEGGLSRLNRQAGNALQTVHLQPLVPATACALTRFYAFSVETTEVVAGREALRVTVRPRDTLRLGYVMDVDQETSLPLRVVTVTPEGQVLERFEFAQFELLGSAKEESQTPLSSADPRFQFASLPPGFSVIGRGTAPVEHRVVSDGLASVSVFIEPQPRALASGEGVVLRGSTLAYTRGTPAGQLITVMGEVPISTARLLADAVRADPDN